MKIGALFCLTALLLFRIQTGLHAQSADAARFFNSGRAAYSDGAYAMAVGFFEKALAVDPDGRYADESSYFIGMSYFQDGKFETAVQAFVKFINSYPESLHKEKALFGIGNAYFRMKNYEKAVQSLRNFIKAHPGSKSLPNAHFLAGYSLLLAGKPASAAEEFSILIRKFPASPVTEESHFRLGQAYFYDRDYAGAEDTFLKFYGKYPNSVYQSEVQFFLGKTYYLNNKTEFAVRELLPLTDMTNFSYRFESLYYVSMGQIKLDQYDHAAASLTRLTVPSEGGRTNEYREEALYKLGLIHKMQNRLDEAIGVFGVLVADYRNSEYTARALSELGACYLLKEDLDNAIATYERIATLGGENVPLSISKIGELKFLKKDYTGAVSEFDKLIQKYLDTEYGRNALYWKGRSHLEAGNYRAALESFERYNKADPLSTRGDEINMFIGNAMVGLADYNSALISYHSVLRFPDTAFADDALNAIAWVYVKKEEYVRATEYYRRLIATYPDSSLVPLAYYSLGIIQYNLKDYGQAQVQFRKVMSDYRSSPYAGDASVKTAWILYKQEKFRDLDSFLAAQDLSKLNPEQKAEALNLKGWAKFRLGFYREAIVHFQESVDTAPGRDKVLEGLLYIAKSWYNLEDYTNAVAGYQTFIEKAKSFNMRSEIPAALSDMAWCYIRMGETDLAAAAYRDLTVLYPSSPFTAEALFKLGEYHYNKADYNRAIENYQKIISLTREGDLAASAMYWIGWSYLNLNDKPRAVSYFERYATAYPKADYITDALWRAASVYYELNDYQKSKTYYERLVREFPKSPEADRAKVQLADLDIRIASGGNEEKLYQLMIAQTKTRDARAEAMLKLASYYKRVERTEEAVKLWNEITGLTSAEPAAVATLELADWNRIQGQYVEAIKLYGGIFYVYKSADLYPRGLYGLAFCYWKTENAETAKKYLDRLIDRYPSSEWTAKGRDLLKEIGQ